MGNTYILTVQSQLSLGYYEIFCGQNPFLRASNCTLYRTYTVSLQYQKRFFKNEPRHKTTQLACVYFKNQQAALQYKSYASFYYPFLSILAQHTRQVNPTASRLDLSHIHCCGHIPQLLRDFRKRWPSCWISSPTTFHQRLPFRITPCWNLWA